MAEIDPQHWMWNFADIADLTYDHVSKIFLLIAAAQKGRQKQTSSTWTVGKWMTRHIN